jgi:hypothetical protein
MINLRRGIAAAALLSAAVLTAACSSTVAGTGSAASIATTSTSTTSSSTSSSATTTDESTTYETTTDDTETTETSETSEIDPASLDATTAIWLQNSCTDVTTLLGALFALPTTVDETSPLEDYRIAFRDYYASVADTALGMTERMSALDPPTIEGGQALHDGYLNYLLRLADITGSGAIVIDEAVDAAAISAAIDQINFEIERLGEEDFGLADFQSAELQALMAQVPECAELMI